jgi:hypothetical protein
MLEKANQTPEKINRLLELPERETYLSDICQIFESRHLAALSQSFFELLAITAAFYEKLRGTDHATTNIQISQTKRTADKRRALAPWQTVHINGQLNYTYNLCNSLRKQLKGLAKQDGIYIEPSGTAKDFLQNQDLNDALASNYSELSAIFTFIKETLNGRSHVSSITLGGGIMICSAPLKILEVTESIVRLTEGLLAHEIFNDEYNAGFSIEIRNKIDADCRQEISNLKELIAESQIIEMLTLGIQPALDVQKGSDEGEGKARGQTDTSPQVDQLRMYVGNLVELIARNNASLREEINDSALTLASNLQESIEKGIAPLRKEVSLLSGSLQMRDEGAASPALPVKSKADSGDPAATSRSSNRGQQTKITQAQAVRELERIKQEVMQSARNHFNPAGKPVEYYHCIVNKTMYEAYMYNRITDIRSREAAEFIDRLITSRNPRHADVVKWQLDKYGDKINRILSAIAYPLCKEDDADEIPF